MPITHQFGVHTNGSVVPRTESELVSEVDGRVLRVSAELVSGGFFSKDEVLVEIDKLDYQVALEGARAGMARAKSELANELKDNKRQEGLGNKGSISASQLDNSVNRVTIARATVREALARLARAERDLARTRITAPYDGRVRSERVDVGQFVRRGEAIGTLYAVDFAEVRLPIHSNELKYLNLPISKAGQSSSRQADVTLTAEFAGSIHQWQGKVVRTEGELDPTTRMVHVVARFANPYNTQEGSAPLAVGLFVDAIIHGKINTNVTVLPRSALRNDSQVLVLDNEDKLRFREVKVLRLVDDLAYIGAGVKRGERICVSVLQSTFDGMRVRVVQNVVPS
jgi:RND family efflux transporter MFP subunit